MAKIQMEFEEKTTKNEIWYKWLKYRIKEYMILEAVVFIISILVLINSYTTTAQNEKMFEMMANMEKNIELLKPSKDQEHIKQSPPYVSNFKMTEAYRIMYGVRNYEKQSENPSDQMPSTKSNENISETIKTSSNDSPITPSSQFNAANFLFGASVDSSRSSHSNLSPYVGRDQSSLVLLDRPNPPVHKTWCSHEQEPILSVNLAKYIKPIAVSYQHFNWNRTIPLRAPRTYSVFACIDFYCETTQLLVSNCQYKNSKDKQQEQFCQIPSNPNLTSIGKVQFKFNENHGDMGETCVSLVRVYGETKEIPKIKERTLEEAETCSNLKNDFYHHPVSYQMNHKNCSILYSYQCYKECPECCDDCLIVDINGETIGIAIAITITAIMVIGFIILVTWMCYGAYTGRIVFV